MQTFLEKIVFSRFYFQTHSLDPASTFKFPTILTPGICPYFITKYFISKDKIYFLFSNKSLNNLNKEKHKTSTLLDHSRKATDTN